MHSPSAYHLLEFIEITGGYLQGARFDFLPGLNCLIGGRGAGKTTVVEAVRFGVGAQVPASRAAAQDAHIRGTLGTGKVTVGVRTQHGVCYESSRSYGEAPRVTTGDGTRVDVSLDGELFTLELYSQNEIESIATSPAAQLALIDKFIDADARHLADSIAQLLRRLALNAIDVLALQREVEEDEDRTRELPSIEEALKGLNQVTAQVSGPDAAEAARAFEHKALRGREHAALAYAADQLAGLRAELDTFAVSAQRRLGGAVAADIEHGPNSDVFAGLTAELRAVGGIVEEAAGRMRTELGTAAEALAGRRRTLSAVHAKQDDAYQALLLRTDEDRGKLAERNRLEARNVELQAAVKRLSERRRASAERREERRGMLAELTRLRDERFALREGVTRELSTALGGDVRVSITQAKDAAAYEELVTDLLRGHNIRPASFVKELVRNIQPDDLCVLVEKDDIAPIVAIDDSKANKIERAGRILSALRTSGRMSELETVALEDVPLIELKTGALYKPSAQVSTGQRCTSILPILLLNAVGPLLIDQPEDNLDNAFIYDVLVKSVAIAKRSRQLIFVTHNPNIPVLGDAERVFVLGSEGDRGSVVQVGSVDELRTPIERILEGGREAFLLRSRRYGHAP